MNKYKQVGNHVVEVATGNISFHTDIDPQTGNVVCTVCAGVLVGGGEPCNCDERQQLWVVQCPLCDSYNVNWAYGDPEANVSDHWECFDCGCEWDIVERL